MEALFFVGDVYQRWGFVRKWFAQKCVLYNLSIKYNRIFLFRAIIFNFFFTFLTQDNIENQKCDFYKLGLLYIKKKMMWHKNFGTFLLLLFISLSDNWGW